MRAPSAEPKLKNSSSSDKLRLSTGGHPRHLKTARNIPGVVTTTAKILSVYDIVNAEKLVIDQKALAIIEEVFA